MGFDFCYCIIKEVISVFTYDDMLVEADNNNLITKEKPLKAHKGLIDGKNIAIKKDMTEAEKKCVVAEELGHYYTGVGNILDQSSVSNRKQELHGRVYAYNKLIGLMGIIGAHKNHCSSLSEAAEYLDVTEDFLSDALNYYKTKYGKRVNIDNYIIYFEPYLGVLELS